MVPLYVDTAGLLIAGATGGRQASEKILFVVMFASRMICDHTYRSRLCPHMYILL